VKNIDNLSKFIVVILYIVIEKTKKIELLRLVKLNILLTWRNLQKYLLIVCCSIIHSNCNLHYLNSMCFKTGVQRLHYMR